MMVITLFMLENPLIQLNQQKVFVEAKFKF